MGLKPNFLKKLKDGGSKSNVDAYFLIEWKQYFSIAVLKFNKGTRENYHSHAFNAISWYLSGHTEEEIYGRQSKHRRGFQWRPKFTPRDMLHRIIAHTDSWCLTIRGSWVDNWFEVTPDGEKLTLTHGRKIVNVNNIDFSMRKND